MLVPVWAERCAPTTWHPHHIAERYGLFTIITLGESILAASIAVRAATEAGAGAKALGPVVVGGLLIVFSFWWLYFDRPGHEVLVSLPSAFLWGYLHYFVFAAAAAVGAGLAVAVDHATHASALSGTAAGLAVAVPVAVYLACLWLLHARSDGSPGARVAAPLVIALVLLTPMTRQPVLSTGLVMAGLVAYKTIRPGVAAEEGRPVKPR
jgi:low temperature requirement protein LtrA